MTNKAQIEKKDAQANPRLSLVFDVIAKHRSKFVFVLVLLTLDAALNSLGIGMILPVMQALTSDEQLNTYAGKIMPSLLDMSQNERITVLAGATIALFALRAGVNYAFSYYKRSFCETMRMDWIAGIGRNYLAGPYSRLLEKKQGELLNNWQNETASGVRFFIAYFGYLSALLQTLALIILSLVVDWQITLVLLLSGILVMLILRKTAFASSTNLGAHKLALHQSLTAHMNEDLTNARDIKIMGSEGARLQDLDSIAAKLKKAFVKLTILGEAPRILGEFFAVAGLMGFVIIAVVFLGKAPADILPILAFFLVAFYRLMTAASMMVSSRIRTLNDLHSVALVHDLSQTKDVTLEDKTKGLPIKTLESDIHFDTITYGYGANTPVLKKLDVTIPRQKLTFLVGPSGAGKSTLLDLLMRLDEPKSGAILANGNDAKAYRLSDWRKLFGYVSQEANLFNGTLRSNFLLAKADATEQDMWDVCALAGAESFIKDLPEKLDTAVGDRGFTLSGGQRKRIAIARALLTQPQVLILDEATTSFEERMEREMIADIRNKLPELTILQITHRLQTADGADHVISLENGNVVATGTWQEIMPTQTMQKTVPQNGKNVL